MRGGGDIMVLCGELIVAVAVLSCELVVVRGGRARPCWWSRFYTCLAGTAPRGVRFPSHGIGLVRARRAAVRALPRNDHRCAETDAARSALARGGAGDCLFKVNKSHRQSNIFSQQQKTVPHSAIAEAGRRRVPGQLPRALPPAGPRGRGGGPRRGRAAAGRSAGPRGQAPPNLGMISCPSPSNRRNQSKISVLV